MNVKWNKHYIIYAGLILYSFLIMLFCTKSSPIYVLNDWYDANAYFTMGKGIINGSVPYKDLFDHKGPFLYFIYGIGYLLNNNSFFGVFILQIIAMSITLIFSFKIAEIYNLSRCAAFMVAVLVPMAILSNGFYILGNDFGGGSPDEFIIPIFSIVVYLIIKLVKEQNILKSNPLYWLTIGLLSSLIFQLKFSHLILVFGLIFPILFYFLIKNFYVFIISFFLSAAGFIVGLTPYILYALITNSLNDFLHVYIKFNKIYASNNNGKDIWSLLMSSTQDTVNIIQNCNVSIFIIVTLGLFYLLHSYKKDFILNISISMSCISFIVVSSVVAMGYNFIILGVFSIFGYIAIYDIFKNIIKKNHTTNRSIRLYNITIFVFTICLIFVSTITNNECIFINLNKIGQVNLQKPCQEQVTDIILSDSDENHSLLEVLSLDSGFYTLSNIIPKSKYFYIPNISFDKYPYVYLGQYEDVCNKLNKYVISTFQAYYKIDIDMQNINSQNYVDKISCAIAKNYELIDTIDGTYLQSGRKFYLYKRIN